MKLGRRELIQLDPHVIFEAVHNGSRHELELHLKFVPLTSVHYFARHATARLFRDWTREQLLDEVVRCHGTPPPPWPRTRRKLAAFIFTCLQDLYDGVVEGGGDASEMRAEIVQIVERSKGGLP